MTKEDAVKHLKKEIKAIQRYLTKKKKTIVWQDPSDFGDYANSKGQMEAFQYVIEMLEANP